MKRHAGKLWIVPVVAGAAAIGFAQEGARSSEDDVPSEQLVAQVRVLGRELRELRARVARVEAQLANVAPVASEATKPAIVAELGFVVPGLPAGDFGGASPSELARFLHSAATTGAHEVERLVAFNRTEFYVPDALWGRAASGLRTVAGVPTRAELEVALGAMRSAGPSSQLEGILPAPEAAPNVDGNCVRVLDLVVRHDGATERFRLTAARLGGRWVAAHLVATSAEDDARTFVEDLVASQRSYKAYNTTRFAKSLHELAGARRELEGSENLRLAGLTYPLGARLETLSRDKLEWIGDELRGPFYRIRLTGDERGGYVVEAIPQSPSYHAFSAAVPGTAKAGDPVTVKQGRASEKE